MTLAKLWTRTQVRPPAGFAGAEGWEGVRKGLWREGSR